MKFDKPPFRLAILDMYQGYPNQGMRCIQDIVARYQDQVSYEIFDVRGKGEVPDTDFDIYISTGGPGDPLDFNGVWDVRYFDLIQRLWEHNQDPFLPRKFVFFICHSFQMVCHHFGVGEIASRRSMSFGTFDCNLTKAGKKAAVFSGLDNPFCIADFRNYQVIQPNEERLRELGAKVVAIEKERLHVPLERAIMGIEFSKEFFAVQFHPEADAAGMLTHFQQEDKLKHIINNYGKDKYATMINDLRHPDKILKTNETILPNFLDNAVRVLEQALILV
ncbi:MAG: type 1 glutamine amidotransferase [Saprospiraceae bacterium]